MKQQETKAEEVISLSLSSLSDVTTNSVLVYLTHSTVEDLPIVLTEEQAIKLSNDILVCINRQKEYLVRLEEAKGALE